MIKIWIADTGEPDLSPPTIRNSTTPTTTSTTAPSRHETGEGSEREGIAMPDYLDRNGNNNGTGLDIGKLANDSMEKDNSSSNVSGENRGLKRTAPCRRGDHCMTPSSSKNDTQDSDPTNIMSPSFIRSPSVVEEQEKIPYSGQSSEPSGQCDYLMEHHQLWEDTIDAHIISKPSHQYLYWYSDVLECAEMYGDLILPTEEKEWCNHLEYHPEQVFMVYKPMGISLEPNSRSNCSSSSSSNGSSSKEKNHRALRSSKPSSGRPQSSSKNLQSYLSRVWILQWMLA